MRVYLAVIGLLLAGGAVADEAPLSIVVQEQPGLYEPGADLPYTRLLAALLEGSPKAVTVTSEPGYRGPRNWTDRKYRCIFGGISAPGHGLPPQDTSISPEDWATLVISRPYNILTVHAWTRPETPRVQHLSELGMSVIAVDEILALDLGWHTKALFKGEVVKVGTQEKALDLLVSGRADVAFAYDNDVALYESRNPDALLAADPAFKLLVLEESMMCWPGGGVEAFIAHVDRRLDALRESGELDTLTLKDRPARTDRPSR